MDDRSYGGRVSHEADIEKAAGDAIGDKLAEQNLPAIFASGKRVIGSAATEQDGIKYLTLRFDDGSDMTFIGDFRVQARQGDGVEFADAVEEGNKLMRGELESGGE